jgi:beta-lactamase superfamily II metal-dependent hydrolase
MLPAEQGDAIWLEYGSGSDPHRVLIDVGVRKTYEVIKARIEQLPRSSRQFDLLVITHVDSDHIGAAPKLLADDELGLTAGEVWFNSLRHLPAGKVRGPLDGEAVSDELDRLGWAWNTSFGEEAVVAPDTGPLPVCLLPGGMKLTVLSPTPEGLERLRPHWEQALSDAGMTAGLDAHAAEEEPELESRRRSDGGIFEEQLDVVALGMSRFVPDRAPANGSSIAVLAEFEGASCVLAADAHPDVLRAGLERLCRERQVDRLTVDALKLPHHGSKFNVWNDCLSLLQTRKYLVSTSGRQTRHPDPEGVARAIARGKPSTVFFNYRVPTTEVWDDSGLQSRFGYEAVFPEESGLTVEI